MIRHTLTFIVATLLTSACATIDGVGARLAASDISIIDAALFVREVTDTDIDLADFEDRAVVYRAVDTVAEYRRGDISRDEAGERVVTLIQETRK